MDGLTAKSAALFAWEAAKDDAIEEALISVSFEVKQERDACARIALNAVAELRADSSMAIAWEL